ncbi:MAG: peptidase M28, partial [Aquificota bacterium]
PRLPVHSLVVPLRGYPLPGSRLSDNASFWDKGYPAVMITDTAYYRNPNYHTSRDTPETLDYQAMAQLVKSIALFLEGTK